MGYREQLPPPELRTLVSGVWAFPKNGHVHRVLPDGCMDVLVLDGEARLVGAMQHAVVVPASQSSVVGVRLRPGEAARLFGGLPKELTDSEALLSDLWGDDGRRLADALHALLEEANAHALDADAIIRRAGPIVAAAFQRRLATAGREVDLRTRAAASLLGQGASVHAAAAHVGVSERQLGRRFVERVGLSPKHFARVRRLNRALLLMKRGAKPAEAGALAGYADQPHFTREASELAGITPKELALELLDGHDTSVPVEL